MSYGTTGNPVAFQFGAISGATITFAPKGDEWSSVFDASKETFPHHIGWCGEQKIQHHWRNPIQNSFTGIVPNEHKRFCINCGQQQSRTPPQEIPAGDWTDETT